MKALLLFLMILPGALATAQVQTPPQEKVIYICTPVDSLSPIQSVTIKDREGYGYDMIIAKSASDGSAEIVTAFAEGYDDMTYFGYYADSLGAYIEFDAPEESSDGEYFQWKDLYVEMTCKKATKP